MCPKATARHVAEGNGEKRSKDKHKTNRINESFSRIGSKNVPESNVLESNGKDVPESMAKNKAKTNIQQIESMNRFH